MTELPLTLDPEPWLLPGRPLLGVFMTYRLFLTDLFVFRNGRGVEAGPGFAVLIN